MATSVPVATCVLRTCYKLRVCRTFGDIVGAGTRVNRRYLASAVDVPQKPKRPSGTFMIFSQEKRQQVIADNPNLRFPEIAKVIGRMWRELTEQEKESYQFQARQNMENYTEEMETFKASLTGDEIKMITQQTEQAKNMKAKRKHKQILRKLEKPKRPLTAYSIFLQSKLKNASGSVTDKMASISSEWRQMSDEDKVAYIDPATKAKQDYEAAMEVWEAKMTEQGNLSVVRKHSPQPQMERSNKDSLKRQITDQEDPPF